jgi:hypothetical protein
MKWQLTGRGPEFFLSISRGVDDRSDFLGLNSNSMYRCSSCCGPRNARRMRLLWAKKHAVNNRLYASLMCLYMYCPRKRRAVKWSGIFSTNFCAPPARVHGEPGARMARSVPETRSSSFKRLPLMSTSLEFNPIGCGGVIPTCP